MNLGIPGANKIGPSVDSVCQSLGMLSGWFIFVLSALVSGEVFLRYILNSPSTWTAEVSQYLFIFFAFLSASYGLTQGSHIQIDLLTSRLSQKSKALLHSVTYPFILFYFIVLFWTGTEATIESYQSGIRSPSLLAVPTWAIEFVIPLGALLLILQSLRSFMDAARMARAGSFSHGDRSRLENPFFLLGIAIASILAGHLLLVIYPLAGIFVLLLVFLFSGIPVAFTLGLMGCLGLLFLWGGLSELKTVGMVAYSSLDSFTLLGIPLFVLSGCILSASKIGDQLFDLCDKWLGWVPGGSAVAGVASCAIFAAISGSSPATAATIGIVAVPALTSRGYDRRMVYGSIAAGGTLGILIPPSIPMIIYSSITTESVGQLFIAGVIPGVVLAFLFMAFISFQCWRTGKTKMTKYTLREKWLATKNGIWALLAPVIILGSIYGGICTATEAAGIAVAYSLAVGLMTGNIRWVDILRINKQSISTNTMIAMIIVGGLIFGHFITMTKLPQNLLEKVSALHFQPWVFIVVLFLVLLIMGMLMEVLSIQYIVLPIVFPVIVHLGFNPIWFAVFWVVNLELALITPPVGVNLFVIQGISKAEIKDVIIGVFPFILLMMAFLLVVALFPSMSLWLPSRMR